jgi:hypothetical protein
MQQVMTTDKTEEEQIEDFINHTKMTKLIQRKIDDDQLDKEIFTMDNIDDVLKDVRVNDPINQGKDLEDDFHAF